MQQKAQVYGFLRAAFMHWKQKALYNFRSLGTYTLLWRRKEKLADCKTRPPLWGLRQFCFRTVFVVYFSWWNFFDCFLTTSWNIQKALASCKRHFFFFWVKHYSVLNGELKRHISKQANKKRGLLTFALLIPSTILQHHRLVRNHRRGRNVISRNRKL